LLDWNSLDPELKKKLAERNPVFKELLELDQERERLWHKANPTVEEYRERHADLKYRLLNGLPLRDSDEDGPTNLSKGSDRRRKSNGKRDARPS